MGRCPSEWGAYPSVRYVMSLMYNVTTVRPGVRRGLPQDVELVRSRGMGGVRAELHRLQQELNLGFLIRELDLAVGRVVEWARIGRHDNIVGHGI